MSSHSFVPVVLTLCLPSASLTQLERRGPDQKTIEISTTEKVRVAAEVATIKIGFQIRRRRRMSLTQKILTRPTRSCRYSWMPECQKRLSKLKR